MSTSINMETILTILFVRIDDWYQEKGRQLLAGKRGCKPQFSDSEVMTLMIAHEFLPFPGEQQYLEFVRANYGHLFPQLVEQSQFNRRARGLRNVLEAMRQDWLAEVGVGEEGVYLMDTKPVPVTGYKRSKKRSPFRGSADYGYCVSRKMHYFGYKLVMITTLDGLPVAYDLVPANTDERLAIESIIDQVENADLIGDKGFIGEEWQAQMCQQTGNQILTPKRRNQKQQHPEGFQDLLNRVRERIEGVFHELRNTGRDLERLQAKSPTGLFTRIVAKVTAHLFRFLLRHHYQIDIQTFQCLSDSAF